MDALILFVFIAIIGIVIWIIVSAVSRANKLDEILRKLYSVEQQLKKVNEKIDRPVAVTVNEKTGEVKPAQPPPAGIPPVTEEKKEPEPPKPVIVYHETIEAAKPAVEALSVKDQAQQRPRQIKPTAQLKQSWWQKWLLENPDIEKFIGENLANKIGIAVLVLGIAFFVKYAIDQNWINEIGRVGIGLLCGGLLIGLAHRLRNSYRSFSSVLVGGGLSIFYFSIAFAFHQYHLLSQTVSFIIMIVITVFAVLLSLLYNRKELAILAAIGGFITPFLVSTGQNNYMALFTYLGILNAGLLVLSYYKRWNLIHYIALFFTVIIYGSWLTDQLVHYDIIPYKAALAFGSLFYLQFIAMAIINNLRSNEHFTKFDFALLLAINLLFYNAGMFILAGWNHGAYKGLFTVALAVYNLALAWVFFKRFKADKNFVYLLIGLTLTYISLAAPVQLHGNYITLFWSAETVLLFWLYQRSGISLMKIASLIVLAALTISLLIDWSQLYLTTPVKMPVAFNKAYLTSVCVSIALFIYYRLMYVEAGTYYLNGLPNKLASTVLFCMGMAVLYISGLLEIRHQFATRVAGMYVYVPYVFLYTSVFAAVLSIVLKQMRKQSWQLITGITAFVFIFYCGSIDRSNYLFTDVIINNKSALPVLVHWAGVLFLLWLMYNTIRAIRENYNNQQSPGFITYIITAALLVIISFSLRYPWLLINSASEKSFFYYTNLYEKAVLTISWGLSSFIMMWLGLKTGFKTLRWCSIILFGITLVKLFLYDIQNIPPGGKIAAFILLGVLLLTISFMYQRLKKLIIDDKKEKP